MLTQERKKIITGIINANQKLVDLEPSEALKEINAHGHKFTLEEIKEYGNQAKASQNELGFDELENVAGGVGGDDMEEDQVFCIQNFLCGW